MLKVASWIDDTAKSIIPQWDKEQILNNRLSQELLGMGYRDPSESLIEMGESLINLGIIKDKRIK